MSEQEVGFIAGIAVGVVVLVIGLVMAQDGSDKVKGAQIASGVVVAVIGLVVAVVFGIVLGVDVTHVSGAELAETQAQQIEQQAQQLETDKIRLEAAQGHIDSGMIDGIPIDETVLEWLKTDTKALRASIAEREAENLTAAQEQKRLNAQAANDAEIAHQKATIEEIFAETILAKEKAAVE